MEALVLSDFYCSSVVLSISRGKSIGEMLIPIHLRNAEFTICIMFLLAGFGWCEWIAT